LRAALDNRTAERLAKMCAMLSSDHDGERAAAALLVTRTLRSTGLTWEDVFSGEAQSTTHDTDLPHHAKAAWALQYQGLLSAWEVSFLQSISRQRRATAAQLSKLEEIIAELRNLAAAGARK
jgi:hypothetical protein